MSDAGKTKLTGSFDLLPKSLDLVKKNLAMFVILSLLPVLGSLSSAGFGEVKTTDGVTGFDTPGSGAAAAAAIAVFFVVYLLATVMLLGLEVVAAQNKKPSWTELWDFARKYTFRLIGLSIVLGLTIAGGLLLLIVPGLIFIRRYLLAPYVMVDQDLGIIESMKVSSEISKPHAGYVWSLIGVSVLLSIPQVLGRVGALISAVLLFAYSVAPALRYFELKKAAK